MRIWRYILAAAVVMLAAAPLHAAEKAFKPQDIAAEAQRLEAQNSREAHTDGKGADVWIRDGIAAIRRDDWRAAASAFAAAAAADPKSEQAWRNLAVSLLRLPTRNWQERRQIPLRAAGAAYNAYLHSPDARAEGRAIALVADALARREEWRPALDAYKASLALDARPDVRAAYEKLREERGFRVLNYTVDSDAASPRVCLQFSEELARGRVDFAPYVRLEGADLPAVAREDQQLCVDGLEHGRSYRLTVRAGLPSAIDEDLLRDADFTIYVRDRKPSVRFTGRAYVLPRTGQQGIPLVSVNLDRVEVEIYRVGDRGLAGAVVGGDFQRQLGYGALSRLRSSTGAQVFKGEIEVERRLNADVTTAVPIDAAVQKLEPGVHVMLARPAGTSDDEDYETRATQWFVVSDIGLTAVSGGDGLHAFVRSLASAEPMRDTELRLIARSNEVLGTVRTDQNGYARFAAGLSRGEGGASPAVLVASTEAGDYAFLNLLQPAFDLSDRGVTGRTAPGPLDAHLFAERGVFRPGETAHVTALLRDERGNASEELPLTMIVERPDGTEDRRAVVADAGAGGRVLDVPLVDTATTGTWRVKAYADTKRPPVGETSFLVEDYVPERLELKLSTSATSLGPTPASVAVEGRWLYGAPAADLAIEGEVTLQASATPPGGLAGYHFGLADETLAAQRTPLDALPRTDASGRAGVPVARPPLPDTTRPLEAVVALRLREPGGRALERSITLPVRSERPMIGVRPLFDARVGEGETAGFDVRVVGPDGKPVAARNLRWELFRIQTRFQFFSRDGRFDFERVTSAAREADGRIDVAAGAPARISAKVAYGRYRLDVTTDDPNGPATSITFDAGWYAAASADTPDALEVALDKTTYRPGETANLRIGARFAGRATIAVVSDRVIDTRVVDVPASGTSVPIPVTDAWEPGAYLVAFLHRPLDAAASRMPGRAVGVVHARIDPAPRTLTVDLGIGERASPRETLRVPIRIGNLGAGETAHLVVAAVDVGILNLTRYEPPAPEERAFGQRRLGAEIRDLYGALIDGMTAQRGRIRTGGDGGGESLGEAPTQEPVALFSGLVTAAPDGTAEVNFDLPAFNGTVKVMAAAWSRARLGHAARDVVVADPVVVAGTLPRFLALEDRSRLRLDLDNVSGPAGDYRVAVQIDGNAVVGRPEAMSQTVALAAGARAAVTVPLAGVAVGQSALNVTVAGPDGRSYEQSFNLSVRPAFPLTSSSRVVTLAPKGGSITVSADLVRDFVYGTGSVALSVGPRGALAPAALIAALEDYAYGCSEQLSSRLLAFISAEEFGLPSAPDAAEKAAGLIARILSRQDSSGGFGLWAAGSDDLWLSAYVVDVLGRAREKGFAVADRAFGSGLDRLRNVLGFQSANTDGISSEIPYAHYVLARNGRAMIGDLRYLADARLEAIASPLGQAQLGAALTLIGDRTRAARAFAAAEKALAGDDEPGRSDYGSRLRDNAGVLALAAESGASVVPAVARRIDAAGTGRRTLSTQENAWLLRAAQALKGEAAKLSLTVNGSPFGGALNRTFRGAALGAPVTIANPGDQPVTATVTIRGAPRTAEARAVQGFTLDRAYFTPDGQPADPARVAQNTRLIVVLTATQPEPQAGRLLMVDRLPAGFEIDNPRLVASGETGAMSWLPQGEQPDHSEFRDDRFVAAFEQSGGDQTLTAAYVVRAVAPGRYVHPPASIEDMYRPERYARTGAGQVEVTDAR